MKTELEKQLRVIATESVKLVGQAYRVEERAMIADKALCCMRALLLGANRIEVSERWTLAKQQFQNANRYEINSALAWIAVMGDNGFRHPEIEDSLEWVRDSFSKKEGVE